MNFCTGDFDSESNSKEAILVRDWKVTHLCIIFSGVTFEWKAVVLSTQHSNGVRSFRSCSPWISPKHTQQRQKVPSCVFWSVMSEGRRLCYHFWPNLPCTPLRLCTLYCCPYTYFPILLQYINNDEQSVHGAWLLFFFPSIVKPPSLISPAEN